MSKTFEQRFLEMQQRIVVGKDIVNAFGGFKYRTKPAILESLKPLQKELNIVVKTTSDLVELGGRIFIKSTAIAYAVEDKTQREEATAFAELQDKKGTKMSEPQLTGSSDSYAGKYALGNLFNIDDNNDPDAQQHEEATGVKEEDVKKLNTTTVDEEKKTLMDVRRKIVQTTVDNLTLEMINEILDEIGALGEDTVSIQMINTKAKASKLDIKYNETTKRWEK